MTPTRRPFAFLSSTIALIAVALLASSGSLAASLTRASLAAATVASRPSVEGENGQASEPGDRGRTAFLHAQAPSTGRIHASGTNGSDSNALALGAEHARLDLAARRAPGVAVDARQDGVASPGQPAPSSRAPPIG